MSLPQEAIDEQLKTYSGQLVQLCLRGGMFFSTVFRDELKPLGNYLETLANEKTQVAAGCIALFPTLGGVSRVAVPFLHASETASVTHASFHNVAYEMVLDFSRRKGCIPIQRNGSPLMVQTYTWKSEDGRIATYGKP